MAHLITETKKENGRYVIQVRGDLNGATAYELISLLNKDLDEKLIICLNFKEVRHINQFAIMILANALKSPRFKEKEVQLSGLTAKEAILLKNEGINISIGKNCFNMLKREMNS